MIEAMVSFTEDLEDFDYTARLRVRVCLLSTIQGNRLAQESRKR